jgi:lipid A 4'-phosphatase
MIKSAIPGRGLKESANAPFNIRARSILIPLAALIVGSVTIRLLNLDLILERCFWSVDGSWQFKKNPVVGFLYRYGSVPALLVAAGGLGAFIASFFVLSLKPWRHVGAFLALALLIGPGLLINVVLKDCYGRPRPKDVREFGGSHEFRPLGQPTFDERTKSFPSGHASMGFFWFAPAIYTWSRRRRLAWVLAGLALFQGGLMGLARMATRSALAFRYPVGRRHRLRLFLGAFSRHATTAARLDHSDPSRTYPRYPS